MFIKKLHKNAITFLTAIINAIQLNHYPSAWKEAKLNLVSKPGKIANTPLNIRPISLISNISKIAEIIIYKNLLSQCQTLDFISEYQFGFRHQHSNTHATANFIIYTYTKKGKRHNVIAVLLDIEKAFDSVWHKGLIYKLIINRIPNNLINLINSNLTNRKF